MRRLKIILSLLLVLPMAASCYVPDDFLAEIRLARNGDYALVFKGKLTWAPLVQEMREGKLTDEEFREKQAILVRDLKRDSHFQIVEPLGNGSFQVFYERLGRFTGTRMVAFVRRSSEVLTMETRTNGTVHIRGGGSHGRDPQDLRALGLNPQGRLRVITNIPVMKQNAQAVGDTVAGYPGYRVYDWALALGSPTPVLIGQLF